MSSKAMTSMQRVLTTLNHREPDRVPLFLLLTMHGAKELGLTIRDYFDQAEHVAEGQLRLRSKYRHDCLYTFFYAPLEVEAWGGEVLYADNGPPNTGRPVIRHHEMIPSLKAPAIATTPCLRKVLDATALLKKRVGDDCPIIGVVMSPFSLPVMQMGFAPYLDLLLEQPELFNMLMHINETFCVDWANAQLAAGATAICYFDPVSSATIIPPELYRRTGQPIAARTIARIKGPTATHLASGRSLPIIAELAQTGTLGVGTSCLENLADLKSACRGKLTILGNLNGITMRHWDQQETETFVRQAIAAAGAGGGFILSDNHGEIPWQVSDEVLFAIAEAVHRWGRYPLDSPTRHER
jgi:uroporphyrinogen decarboxylase